MIGYYYDLFKEKPNEIYRGSNGEIQFSSGGADPLYDEMERKAAAGEDIDLWEFFPPGQKEKVLQKLEDAKKRPKGIGPR